MLQCWCLNITADVKACPHASAVHILHALGVRVRVLCQPLIKDLPLQAGTADVVPPAVGGYPQTLRRGLTLETPQTVRAIFVTEVAPDGHQHLSVGTLEVEALAVAVDPLHVVVVIVLSGSRG